MTPTSTKTAIGQRRRTRSGATTRSCGGEVPSRSGSTVTRPRTSSRDRRDDPEDDGHGTGRMARSHRPTSRGRGTGIRRRAMGASSERRSLGRVPPSGGAIPAPRPMTRRDPPTAWPIDHQQARRHGWTRSSACAGQQAIRGQRPRALDDVDLDIEAGRITAIMGPSGCGKSTLLNLIGGLDRPSIGRDRRSTGSGSTGSAKRQPRAFAARTSGSSSSSSTCSTT